MFRILFLIVGVVIREFCMSHTNSGQIIDVQSFFQPSLERCADENSIDITLISIDNLEPCFLSCFAKNYGILNNSGLFDPYATLDLLSKFMDSSLLYPIQEGIFSCQSVNYQEVSDGKIGCDRADLLYDCLQNSNVADSMQQLNIFNNEQNEILNYFQPSLEQCADENNLDDYVAPESLPPCFIACFAKNHGIFNISGYFDPYGTVDLMSKFLNEAQLSPIREGIFSCQSVNNQPVTDGEAGCDRAQLLMQCVQGANVESFAAVLNYGN